MSQHTGTACIISTGEEVLRGELVDSNSAAISQLLGEAGFAVQLMFTTGDRAEDLRWTIETALERADHVFITGGLGPTEDDLTTEVVAALAGAGTFFHEPSWQWIEDRFREFGIPVSENNRKQAVFPQGAQVLANPNGTAPGFMMPLQRAGRDKRIVALPGPPREMTPMVQSYLAGLPGAAQPSHSFIRLMGIGESTLAEVLAPWASHPGEIGFRHMFPEVEIKLYDASAARIRALREFVLAELVDHLVDFRSASIPELFADFLIETGRTVAVAESCTGGLVGKLLTDRAGASQYFLGGIVAYHNDVKARLLDVPEALIAEHGAVSEPVAARMAAQVRERFDADIGIAVTGIAGPEGGTEDKPVGTVWFGHADAASTGAQTRRFVRGRDWIRTFAAHEALRQAMAGWLRQRWDAALAGG